MLSGHGVIFNLFQEILIKKQLAEVEVAEAEAGWGWDGDQSYRQWVTHFMYEITLIAKTFCYDYCFRHNAISVGEKSKGAQRIFIDEMIHKKMKLTNVPEFSIRWVQFRGINGV